MRLISCDGGRDVAYENCHLVMNPKTFEIEAITINPNFEPVMGVYSTESKALKVMEMVRKKYLETTVVSSGGLSFRTLPRAVVFKFPSDDEVEV